MSPLHTASEGPSVSRGQSGAVDWYDLPEWYDILHAPGTGREVDGLQAIAYRFAPTGLYRDDAPQDAESTSGIRTKTDRVPRRAPLWIEPACGSGRYLRIAAARGIRGIGLDLNPRMVRFARRTHRDHAHASRVPFATASYRVADIADFSVRTPGDFAFCPINSVRHLPTDDAMLAHFGCMEAALRPGAVYAVGLGLTDYLEADSEDVWVGARAGVRVHQLVTYLAPQRRARREQVLTHLTVSRGKSELHYDSTYTLRTYNRVQWLNLIARSALELVAVTDEQGNDLPEGDGLTIGYAVWILASRRSPKAVRGRPGPVG